MAFQNVIFPTLKLKHGIVREVVDPVMVTGNGAREVRRKQNRWERFVWTIPSRNLAQSDIDAIYKFLNGVDKSLDSFLFQDPHFPEFNNSKLTNKATNQWYLNLPFDSSTAGTHPVMNPVLAGLSFKKNGVAHAVTPTFAVDANGFPVITIPSTSPSDVVTITGPVYMTVRFEGTLTTTIMAMQKSTLGGTCNVTPTVSSIGDFRLVEVWER